MLMFSHRTSKVVACEVAWEVAWEVVREVAWEVAWEAAEETHWEVTAVWDLGEVTVMWVKKYACHTFVHLLRPSRRTNKAQDSAVVGEILEV